ncbi:uncharacterized protein BXZ73DRAFT_57946 [Epithele typhae]|uniref:uncharacterized protein n=1 Tax=Epithele typhae TaxID=378194 RepID=UPI002008D649|nr:uncharacterized protein BXZ73DRAFT_57946 [Epithele typhae]KAH9910650.1 hypothetical protein BXZ73DRAFT_57946 [Epithele typhae]
MSVQAKLIHALCVLHNFIRIHDPEDLDDMVHAELDRVPNPPELSDLGTRLARAEQKRASDRRERIAQAMWDSYQAYVNGN